MVRVTQIYKSRVAKGELSLDAAQAAAAERLQTLAMALKHYRPAKRLFFTPRPPKGLYIWGDVGRGKSMLMDLFFEAAPVGKKRRVHFNEFMVQTHARIHELRQREADPIPPVARMIAADATLLCFDEFQVGDVADAMILGRLFQQLFDLGVVVVATSNTAPVRLYEGGLNRELFLPFIALIEQRLDVVELNGSLDYRLQRMEGLDIYMSPLGPETDAKMDAAWRKLTDCDHGRPTIIVVQGRELMVRQTANGVARMTFEELCSRPLAAADYLALARAFHTILIDRIPEMGHDRRDEARRFVVLIDTLYDTGTKLVCSAATVPERLYMSGDGADAFRRTVSRLREMQSVDYLKRVRRLS